MTPSISFLLPARTVLASVGDPDGTRAVTSIIVLLVALGLFLVMIAVWLFKSTRSDPEVLAPLEVMGERKWRRADPVWQRRRLDDLRPVGAEPLEPATAPPAIDATFDDGPAGSGFDDLRESDGEREGVPAPSGSVSDPTLPPPAPGAKRVDAPTPTGTERPDLAGLPDHEIDAELLAAARAELEAELRTELRFRVGSGGGTAEPQLPPPPDVDPPA